MSSQLYHRAEQEKCSSLTRSNDREPEMTLLPYYRALLALCLPGVALACGAPHHTGAAPSRRADLTACPDSVISASAPAIQTPVPRLEVVPPQGAPKGTYQLTVIILPNGLVDTARTTVSPPFPPEYDRAFRKQLLQWKFWPATKGSCTVEAPFRYTLEL